MKALKINFCTLGAPYEGKAQLNDIKGFANKPGEVIPNDDLDLQLAWLCALEAKGPYNMSSKVLAEYWIDLIAPHWSECGICKGNLESGISVSAVTSECVTALIQSDPARTLGMVRPKTRRK